MKPARLIPTEHQEQCVVIDWWDMGAAHAFGLERDDLFAIPNAGAGASRGQAGKMKAEGARSGIPDFMLAVPRGKYAGLFVEMKRREGGRMAPEQTVAHERLARRGYFCVTCFGADAAMQAIRTYLA